MARPRSSNAQALERVDRAEEMLASGLSAEVITRVFSGPERLDADGRNIGGYDLARRTARWYVEKVYHRWDEQRAIDDPRRRDKLIRMAERLFAKAVAAGQLGAAASTLGHLARMTGVLEQPDPAREAALAQLGPAPTDPARMMIYAQRCMVVELTHLIANRSVDPERRMRWVVEIAGRLATSQPRALYAQRAEDLERQLQALAPVDPAAQADAETEAAMQELARRLSEGLGGVIGRRDPGDGA